MFRINFTKIKDILNMRRQKLSDDAGSKDDQVDDIAAPTTPEVADSADSDSVRKPAMRVVDLS